MNEFDTAILSYGDHMARHHYEKVTGKDDSGRYVWVMDEPKTRKSFEDAKVDSDGVARWDLAKLWGSKWNGVEERFPPEALLRDWASLGLPFDLDKTLAASQERTQTTLSAYRERMKNHEHSEEEKAEMRAAFGPGAEVVNIITGKVTKL